MEKTDKEVLEQEGAKFAKVEIASFVAFAIFCKLFFVWFWSSSGAGAHSRLTVILKQETCFETNP